MKQNCFMMMAMMMRMCGMRTFSDAVFPISPSSQIKNNAPLRCGYPLFLTGRLHRKVTRFLFYQNPFRKDAFP